MDPNLATSIIAGTVAIGGSWFVTRGDRNRIAALESRIDRLERRDRRWWAWAQDVITIYREWRRTGAPDLPRMPDEEDD